MLSSSSRIARALPSNETSHQFSLLTTMVCDEWDFAGEKFNWSRPEKYNQIPGLPVYIGEGAVPPFSSVFYPVTIEHQKSIGECAVNFIDAYLKPAQAAYVVAMTEDHWWGYGSYFGAFHWDSEDKYSFFNKFENREDIKWLSFVDEQGEIVTLISKRKDNLYHWKAFKGDALYHEAHILHLSVSDGNVIELDKKPGESAQILHDMLCEALEKNQGLYNHCAAGIGRSAIATLAELIMIQQSPYFKNRAPANLPPLQDDQYPIELLAWAHHNVRTGLLGLGDFRRKLKVNIDQVHDCLQTGAHLLELHQFPEKRKTVADRVLLTAEETDAILKMTQDLEENKTARQEYISEQNIVENNANRVSP